MIYERIDEAEFVRLLKQDNYSSLQHASDEGLEAVYNYLEESGEDVEFDGVAIRSQFSWNDYEDLISAYGDEVADELGEASAEDLSGYSNRELQPIFERVLSNGVGYATLVHIDDEGAIISE